MSLKRPKTWNTRYQVVNRTLVIRLSAPRRTVSSAVHGGGIVRAAAIINHQVPSVPLADHRHQCRPDTVTDPSRYLGRMSRQLGLPGPCVGLMTAVDMRQLVLKRVKEEGLWIEGFFTVGVTNAVRAGDPIHWETSRRVSFRPGTINMILITNAKLSSAALIGAIGVATESKTALLLEKHIPTYSGSGIATGTGTDAVVIATGDGPQLRYSGTHTKIGELIARIVDLGVREGLARIEQGSSRKETDKPSTS